MLATLEIKIHICVPRKIKIDFPSSIEFHYESGKAFVGLCDFANACLSLRFFYVIERSSRKKNIPVVKEVMEEFSVTFENAKNLMRRRKGNSSW